MVVRPSAMFTSFSLPQPLKAYWPMFSTVAGSVIFSSAVQPSKARLPTLVRPLFSATSVSPVHPLNTFSPMVSTVSGNTTEVSITLSMNASSAIC